MIVLEGWGQWWWFPHDPLPLWALEPRPTSCASPNALSGRALLCIRVCRRFRGCSPKRCQKMSVSPAAAASLSLTRLTRHRAASLHTSCSRMHIMMGSGGKAGHFNKEEGTQSQCTSGGSTSRRRLEQIHDARVPLSQFLCSLLKRLHMFSTLDALRSSSEMRGEMRRLVRVHPPIPGRPPRTHSEPRDVAPAQLPRLPVRELLRPGYDHGVGRVEERISRQETR